MQLIIKALSSPISPFVRKKVYIEAYAGLAYVGFVKLYQSKERSPEMTELCDLYLRILLAFATSKSEKAAKKLFQLRAMDFMVRELMLEYETKFEWTKYSSPQEQKPFFASSEASLPSTPQLGAISPDHLGGFTSISGMSRSCPPSPEPGSSASSLSISPLKLKDIPKLRLGTMRTPSPACSPPATDVDSTQGSRPHDFIQVVPFLSLNVLKPKERQPRPEQQEASELETTGGARTEGVALAQERATRPLRPPQLVLDQNADDASGETDDDVRLHPVVSVPKLKFTPDTLRRSGLRRDDSSSQLLTALQRSGSPSIGVVTFAHAGRGLTQLERQLVKNPKLQLQLDNKNPKPRLTCQPLDDGSEAAAKIEQICITTLPHFSSSSLSPIVSPIAYHSTSIRD